MTGRSLQNNFLCILAAVFTSEPVLWKCSKSYRNANKIHP